MPQVAEYIDPVVNAMVYGHIYQCKTAQGIERRDSPRGGRPFSRTALQYLCHTQRTVVAHIQHVTGALAEHAVHRRAVRLQQMHRDERLNGARKAAALQTPRTIPLEYMLRKCQTKRNALLPRIFALYAFWLYSNDEWPPATINSKKSSKRSSRMALHNAPARRLSAKSG